jgi:hypothetical protein
MATPYHVTNLVTTGDGRGHSMAWVGNKMMTLPAGEIDPKTAKNIKKALGRIEGAPCAPKAGEGRQHRIGLTTCAAG